MKGFPKHINTKQDVLQCMTKWPEQTKDFIQRMLDNRYSWMVDLKLGDNEAGVNDETHRVVEITNEETGNIEERYQHIWKEDPNCKLFRLGLTVEEAEEIAQTRG